MKPVHLFKIILLAVPVISLLYIFLVRDYLSSKGIGGGGYDLTKLYYTFFTAGYLLLLNIFFLIQGVAVNRHFLLAGGVLLLVSLVLFFKILGR